MKSFTCAWCESRLPVEELIDDSLNIHDELVCQICHDDFIQSEISAKHDDREPIDDSWDWVSTG